VPDPGWASINRGVLICDECCSVHRSLGRHISIVKHLRHSGWPASLLQMVQTLASNGANSIWEHSLLDPAQVQSGRRKPNPQDKVHPTKSEFIRAKYQMLAFVHKLPCRDDDGVTTKDLSKAGQVLQAELLVVYGADPGAPDINGRTPMDYARQAGHVELVERLVECQYELTDRLAFYLCGRRPGESLILYSLPVRRRPDHKNGHYIIPQMADSLDLSELAKAAKKKLQAGRQKLARFNAREFATLIIDILSDAKRRQHGKGLTSPTDNLDYSLRNHGDADDQHDYDSVASDEDTDQELLRSSNSGRNNRAKSMDSSDLSDGPITLQEYLEVKKALVSSESKVQQLMKVNNNLSEELRRLQREIHKLQTENTTIRGQTGAGPSQGSGVAGERLDQGVALAPPRRDRQAFSMYEPGAPPKPFGHQGMDELIRKGVSSGPSPYSALHLSGTPEGGSRYMAPKGDKHGSGTDSDYDNTQTQEPSLSVSEGRVARGGTEDDPRSEVDEGDSDPDPTLPCTEDVILKTEQVTKNIQELLRAAQEFKHDSFVPCSEKIHTAVTEMASLFPKRPVLDAVRSSLRLLSASAFRLQSECRKTVPPEPGAPVDFQLLTQQVIQCAYDIAKAAKQLVTITTREKKQ
ncbi:ARF GTPase-activating protein GIT2, partial [Acipenser ruthenus]